jgi:uncharacterized membrane protein
MPGEGVSICNEDRRLIVETLSEMKELKGEMREFKKHVIERVEQLEKREAERRKEWISIISILISAVALGVSIYCNLVKPGGK